MMLGGMGRYIQYRIKQINVPCLYSPDSQCISGFMSLVIINCRSSETHSYSLVRAHKPTVTWGYSRPNGLE